MKRQVEQITSEAIAAVGGLMEAERLTGYSKSSFSKAQRPESPYSLPLLVVAELEQAVGRDLITGPLSLISRSRPKHAPEIECRIEALCALIKEHSEALDAVRRGDCPREMEKELLDLIRIAAQLFQLVGQHSGEVVELRRASG